MIITFSGAVEGCLEAAGYAFSDAVASILDFGVLNLGFAAFMFFVKGLALFTIAVLVIAVIIVLFQFIWGAFLSLGNFIGEVTGLNNYNFYNGAVVVISFVATCVLAHQNVSCNNSNNSEKGAGIGGATGSTGVANPTTSQSLNGGKATSENITPVKQGSDSGSDSEDSNTLNQ